MASSLSIKDLRVSVEDKLILKGLNLEVNQGEIHAIMGPNGSGKSTMAYALAGHPKYEVEGGEVWMDGVNLLGLAADERRKMLNEKMDLLGIDKSFARRYLNEGFSGGEKKRAEILQMALLEPKFAILDETDSGLDMTPSELCRKGSTPWSDRIAASS